MKSEKYDKIFELNREWVKSKKLDDKRFFKNSHSEQNPEFLYIGCSDSRVPANAITGLDVGDLFVHRNIANVVSSTDLSMLSIIQYAVEVLKVKHIVVCGHHGCGGVESALEQKSFGLLDSWLKKIRDVYRVNYDELEMVTNHEDKVNRLAEMNVVAQVDNVIKTSFVQKSYNKTGYPTVHGWVYDMKSGKLRDMEIDFEAQLREVQKVYKLE